MPPRSPPRTRPLRAPETRRHSRHLGEALWANARLRRKRRAVWRRFARQSLPTETRFPVGDRRPAPSAELQMASTPARRSVPAVEATGGFETVVAASLAAAKLAVVVVNPAQVRAFAQ